MTQWRINLHKQHYLLYIAALTVTLNAMEDRLPDDHPTTGPDNPDAQLWVKLEAVRDEFCNRARDLGARRNEVLSAIGSGE